jgi:phospholipid/cholesterol/gamma-HCH transport system substrate-binding protein
MSTENGRNIKLGLFVLAGTLFLIVLLYLIGDKRSLFGDTFRVSAEFRNVNGLMPGNNVRFSGIDVGTVESVDIITDSSVRVVMVIEERARKFIKKDATASIGTDGLMGNKLVSINSTLFSAAPSVETNDVIKTLRPIETDEMIRTLNTTNDNIRFITSDLRKITAKINSRNSLWSLLMDTVVADNVKQAIVNIKITGARSAVITGDLERVVEDFSKGKGLAASLITDTTMRGQLQSTMIRLEEVGARMARVSGNFEKVSARVGNGEGTLGMLVMDTTFVHDLKSAVKHANSGAEGFQENMEALKHSVFLRKYFRKKKDSRKK